jgi:hypothetical protein
MESSEGRSLSIKQFLISKLSVVGQFEEKSGIATMSEQDEQDEEMAVESQPTFGEWLRKEMDKQEVTIQDLIGRTGISYPGIRNIIKGITLYPRQETRKKLSEALNKPVDRSRVSYIGLYVDRLYTFRLANSSGVGRGLCFL